MLVLTAYCAALCCRIAKLLLFVSLVPESVPALPGDGTASYVRRLWQHPDDSQTPCEVRCGAGRSLAQRPHGTHAQPCMSATTAAPQVQIICGKTIEASLVCAGSSDSNSSQHSSTPTGARAHVRTHLVLQGRARAVALFDQVRVGAVVEVTGRVQANPASRDRPGAVLDVVAQHVAVLHKSR